jgi:hypothetical protein
VRALAKRRGLPLGDDDRAALLTRMPLMLTPGAAEALAVKAFRLAKTKSMEPRAAVAACLDGYQNPVPPAIMDFQIGLAVDEATDLAFVPEPLRKYGKRGER